MIDQKSRIVFEISWPANIPQKWFGTQNGPLDIRSQMRQTLTMDGSDFWKKQAKTMMQSFKNTLKIAPWFLFIFVKNKKLP